jgi:hypothetical protein
MEPSNPFSPLQSRLDRHLQCDAQAQKWEEARVSWLLKRLGLQNVAKDIRSRTANDRILFADFNENFAMFPLQFVAEPLIGETPIDADRRYVHPRWFAGFLDLPIVRAYEEHFIRWRESDDKRPLAMVFPRRGFEQGLMLHNGGLNFIPTAGSAHVFSTGATEGAWLCVQPYSCVIDHIHATMPWS